MPKIQRRERKRRGWTESQRHQLIGGHDWFNDSWGDPIQHGGDAPGYDKESWPSPEVLAEMREAWGDMSDGLMAEHADKLSRPWAWWVFEQGVDPCEAILINGDIERERLDELGLLTAKALAAAARDEQLVHGIRNEAHEPAFRRNWHWWRFLSPERRDKTLAEAVQLVALHKEGHDVLTDREKYVVENKADLPVFRRGCPKVQLSDIECDVLDLPDEFYSELEDD